LASASHDFTVKLWDIEVAAQELAKRPMSAARPGRFRDASPAAASSGGGSDHREQALRAVFAAFDEDGSGEVEASELLALGKARRSTGQKSGSWTEEQNARLIKRMDTNGDGGIDVEEFTKFFSSSLPRDPETFNGIMQQFMEVAKAIKSGKKEAPRPASASTMDRATARPTSASRKDRDADSRRHQEAQEKEAQVKAAARDAAEARYKAREDAMREKQQGKQGMGDAERAKALKPVFVQFDLDNDGLVEKWELLLLGKARRTLGQKHGQWTEETNKRCVDRMDTDHDGNVDVNEFVLHFSKQLSQDREEFLATVDDFMAVARECRAKNQSQTKPSSPKSPVSASKDERKVLRTFMLDEVFNDFDIFGGGTVDAEELMILGQARRSTGQKSGTWTEEQNARLIKRMDTDGNGAIDKEEFATFFSESLPYDMEAFAEVIEQFKECAASVRARKMSQRGSGTSQEASRPSSSPTSSSRMNRTKSQLETEKEEAELRKAEDEKTRARQRKGAENQKIKRDSADRERVALRHVNPAIVEKIFLDLDTDKSGSITVGEIRAASKALYKSLGIEKVGLPLGKMIKLFNSLDQDESGVLDHKEFSNLADKLVSLCKDEQAQLA